MELQVNVAQLLKDGLGARRLLEFEGALLECDDGPASVRGELRLTRTDRGVWASGPLSVSASSTCSRCLIPIEYWIDVQVDDELLPSVDIATGGRLRYHDEVDADTHSIDKHHVLDLSDVVRQYRMAGLPLAPVCREDCNGICPECGTDLNEATCSCEGSLDPRWDKLRELLR